MVLVMLKMMLTLMATVTITALDAVLPALNELGMFLF